ncbi:MAG: MBL fold metallo-hydrolase [Candidatus Omnitrophica bacterium]|nr:MBL fold metallo-hydrolase [Candidatus Omnitrophota bacterium]
MKKALKGIMISSAAILLLISPAQAERDFSETIIKTQKVTDSVYMITGEGGNIAISVGKDGIMMVDDQFAELHPKILAAIKDISIGPIEFVLNTHWHGDHTGGNEMMRAAGAHILAHENVRKRLSTRQVREMVGRTSEARPEEALPVVTFNEGITLHFNEETIDVVHFGPGHTDGDSVVFFKEANVIHMGDLFFQGRFPYIDLDSGGSVEGYLQNIQLVLDQTNGQTKIIPGHGSLSRQSDLIAFREMIQTSTNIVKNAIKEGISLKELLEENPLEAYADWGTGFINLERWLNTLYKYYQ